MKQCPVSPDYYRYHAKGKIQYKTNGTENWVIVNCPNSISYYYNRICRWLLFTDQLSLPYHGSHVTVIAGKYTNVCQKKYKWYYRNNEWVDFWYGPIKDNGEYFWLPVYCPAAVDIRLHYDLTPTPKWEYHLTIGYLNK